jgi:hypothetical protein
MDLISQIIGRHISERKDVAYFRKIVDKNQKFNFVEKTPLITYFKNELEYQIKKHTKISKSIPINHFLWTLETYNKLRLYK